MDDNIINENMEITEEIYKKAIEENIFEEDKNHGIGDETDGNSQNVSSAE